MTILSGVLTQRRVARAGPLAAPMAAEQPTKIEHILADEGLAVTFRNFLHKTACAENLSFWLEVELLKELDETEQKSILACVFLCHHARRHLGHTRYG